jgi:hypothetical protein
MSIEQLLFLLILVALPLLERLIRAMRTRPHDSSAERAGTLDEPAVSASRAPSPPSDARGGAPNGRHTELTLPASPLPPALPQAVRHTVSEQLRPTEGALHVRRDGKHPPTTRLRTGVRSDSPVAPRRVVADADLRRAIVLIAILGPCRGLEAKDASQLGQ